RGGAQREGYVEAFVKYIFYDSVSEMQNQRKNMHSPMIASGDADVLISLEPIETLRAISYVNKNSVIIFNTNPHVPISVRMGKSKYPELDDILNSLYNITDKVFYYDFNKLSIENFGSIISVNVISLGVVFAKTNIPISKNVIENILLKGSKAQDNLRAFNIGLNL
ncbi:MAG: 2-oxoacid:acceptor oxidoreductase family protein, partial [Deltaproteobacteria bacterium]|nr:2-oxoacid:acceptor oxidoreductase family protein [Deltaproteobacteria bacterium]